MFLLSIFLPGSSLRGDLILPKRILVMKPTSKIIQTIERDNEFLSMETENDWYITFQYGKPDSGDCREAYNLVFEVLCSE
jgi:hypothetical protein